MADGREVGGAEAPAPQASSRPYGSPLV